MRARLACGDAFSVVFCTALFLLFGIAEALPRYGPLEVSGNLSAQQLIRHPDIDTYSLVQQRNTLKLRADYSLLQGGQSNVPAPLSYIDTFADQARFFVLYRGVYDSVYDLTPGFEQRDIYGNPIGARLKDVPSRDSVKYENELREAYLDLEFKQVPLSLRLGRQQIVWGETDNFRLLDRVNSLNLSWHLQQESWDELRIPYWMIKGIFNFDSYGWLAPLSNTFLEFYWNPGDWYPAKRAFLPRPWSVPTLDPLPTLVNLINNFSPKFKVQEQLNNGTQLFRQGDYARNPMDNSQVGARLSAVTPQGVQFTLNYFYQRWAGDDGSNTAPYKGLIDKAQATAALSRGQLPIEAIAPYVHAAGFSLNYAEEEYTQTVYRMESIYEFGVPFIDSSKRFPANGPFGFLSNDVFGVSKRDMWKGMLAFDRPTWIRPLNRNSTFLILGQFFWHYLLDNPNIQCKFPDRPFCGGASNPQIKGFRGQFSSSGLTSGGTPFIDKVRDWEVLTTLAATTFYRGGKIVPFLVYVLDPVNSYNMEVIWMCDYFVTNNIILNLSQRYFINTTSKPVFETWGVAGLDRGRSETGLRLTYQF